MKTIIINKENLFDEEIDETVTRVKCFILNGNKEFLLASCGGCFNLPGGHMEIGEDRITAVIREVEEETGIKLPQNEIGEPFLELKKYSKNHKNSGKNRLSIMCYYFIETDKDVDTSKISLTQHEKENNFHILKLKQNDFKLKLQDVIKTSQEKAFRTIAKETLEAFFYLENNIIRK